MHGPGADEPVLWYEGSGQGDRRYFHHDERGSVVAVTNGSAGTIATNTYDEYGVPGASNSGRFAYTGQTWLPEIGMYYYKARIYSPTLGRFLQSDPVGYSAGMNLYGYVGGDPTNKTDPTGNDPPKTTTGECTGSIITKKEGGCGSQAASAGPWTAAMGLMRVISRAAAAGDTVAAGALAFCRANKAACATAALIAAAVATSGSNSGDSLHPMAGASESTTMGPERGPNDDKGPSGPIAYTTLYHGSDLASVESIATKGISRAAARELGGGDVFWATSDQSVAAVYARSNPAGGAPAVVSFRLQTSSLNSLIRSGAVSIDNTGAYMIHNWNSFNAAVTTRIWGAL